MNISPKDMRDRVDRLIDTLENQEQLYRELKDVSNRQIDELFRNDGSTLEILAEKKNRILERIERNNVETNGQYEEVEPHMELVSDSVRFKLDVTRIRVAEALKDAVKTEQRGGEQAQAQLEKISQNLADVNRARRLAKKYKPSLRDDDEPRFLDKLQ